MARDAKLLPADSSRDAPLMVVVAILTFLACLAALAALFTLRASDAWTGDLAEEMTVRLVGETTGEDAVERAVRALERADFVREADPISRSEAETLLRPWLGADGAPDDLPLPVLIEVRLSEDPPADAAASLRKLLAQSDVEAVVDDHSRWAGDVARTAGVVRSLALGTLGVVLAAAAATAMSATQAGLQARRDVVDVLHVVGASDAAVAQLFAGRFFWLGVKAGAIGGVLAAGATWLAAQGHQLTGDAQWFLPNMEFRLGDLWIAALAPILTALVSMATAYVTVRGQLAREP